MEGNLRVLIRREKMALMFPVPAIPYSCTADSMMMFVSEILMTLMTLNLTAIYLARGGTKGDRKGVQSKLS